jgi:hypothetical protein
MNDETSKQLIALLQEQIRLMQIMIAQIQQVNESVHQVFLK